MHFDDDVVSRKVIAIAAINLDIRCRVDLPENFRSCSCAGDDRFFPHNDASGCVQRLRHEKVSRDVAIADVFFKGGGDRIATIWLHERSRMRTITGKCERVYETRMFKTRSDRMSAISDSPGYLPLDKKKIRAAHSKEKQRIQ